VQKQTDIDLVAGFFGQQAQTFNQCMTNFGEDLHATYRTPFLGVLEHRGASLIMDSGGTGLGPEKAEILSFSCSFSRQDPEHVVLVERFEEDRKTENMVSSKCHFEE
jgi:hypothetical protein